MRIKNRKLAIDRQIKRPDPNTYRPITAKEIWSAYKAGIRTFRFRRLDGLDLQDMDLCDASFADSSLRGADFSGSLLLRTSFAHSDLTDASLNTTLVHGCDLSGTDLTRAYMHRADLLGSQM